jgi:uncharacterized protein YfaP (DUF2135 family)
MHTKNAFSQLVKQLKNNYISHTTTPLGVTMRNPIDVDGKWIGWTSEEVANHLQSVSNHYPVKSVDDDRYNKKIYTKCD